MTHTEKTDAEKNSLIARELMGWREERRQVNFKYSNVWVDKRRKVVRYDCAKALPDFTSLYWADRMMAVVSANEELSKAVVTYFRVAFINTMLNEIEVGLFSNGNEKRDAVASVLLKRKENECRIIDVEQPISKLRTERRI